MGNLCRPCGFGKLVNSKPKCDDCIWAPEYIFACINGPVPSENWSFNILTETGYELPPGNWGFRVIDWDSAGINSVTVNASGAFNIQNVNTYSANKNYRVKYEIYEIDGIRKSTGYFEFCMQDLCAAAPEKDCCDPLTGDFVFGSTFNLDADCNQALSLDISSWEYEDIEVIYPSGCVINHSVVNGTLTLNTGNCEAGTTQVEVILKKGMVSKSYIGYVHVKDKCNCPAGYECNNCNGDCIKITGGEFDGIDIHDTITDYTGSGTLTYFVNEYNDSEITGVTIGTDGKVDGYSVMPGNPCQFKTTVNVGVTDGVVTSYDDVIININPCRDCPEDAACDCETGKCLYAQEVVLKDLLCCSVGNAGSVNDGSDPAGTTYHLGVSDAEALNFAFDNVGGFSFDVGCDVLNFKKEYVINYVKKCEKLISNGRIVFTLCDLCEGIPLKENEECNSCTGVVTEKCSIGVSEGDESIYAIDESCEQHEHMPSTMAYEPDLECENDNEGVIDLCEELLKIVDLKNCQECKVVNGKATICDIEEEFDKSCLEFICPDQEVPIVGSCGNTEYFNGAKTDCPPPCEPNIDFVLEGSVNLDYQDSYLYFKQEWVANCIDCPDCQSTTITARDWTDSIYINGDLIRVYDNPAGATGNSQGGPFDCGSYNIVGEGFRAAIFGYITCQEDNTIDYKVGDVITISSSFTLTNDCNVEVSIVNQEFVNYVLTAADIPDCEPEDCSITNLTVTEECQADGGSDMTISWQGNNGPAGGFEYSRDGGNTWLSRLNETVTLADPVAQQGQVWDIRVRYLNEPSCIANTTFTTQCSGIAESYSLCDCNDPGDGSGEYATMQECLDAKNEICACDDCGGNLDVEYLSFSLDPAIDGGTIFYDLSTIDYPYTEISVDWGDNNMNIYAAPFGSINHVYTTPGTYEVVFTFTDSVSGKSSSYTVECIYDGTEITGYIVETIFIKEGGTKGFSYTIDPSGCPNISYCMAGLIINNPPSGAMVSLNQGQSAMTQDAEGNWEGCATGTIGDMVSIDIMNGANSVARADIALITTCN